MCDTNQSIPESARSRELLIDMDGKDRFRLFKFFLRKGDQEGSSLDVSCAWKIFLFGCLLYHLFYNPWFKCVAWKMNVCIDFMQSSFASMSEGLSERLLVCHEGYCFVFIWPGIDYYKQNSYTAIQYTSLNIAIVQGMSFY